MKALRHRWIAAATVAASICLGPRPVVAAPQVLSDPEARAHFEQAQRHFDEQDYASAIPELKAAYALEPNPMLLYAWGQAERMAGSCARAVELYRRFLETNPEPEQRQLAEANLVDCEAELPDDTTATTLPRAPDDLQPMEAEPGSPPDEPPARPWYADPAGGALVGGGMAGVIGGGVLMAVARRKAREAPNASIEDDYLATRQQATRMNAGGIVVLSVGSALVVAGVVRYVLLTSRGRERPESTARWRPTLTVGGLGLTGRF